MRAWLCRIGWHGWDTWVWIHWSGLKLRRVCVRPGCGVVEVR
ncbi:hypothetical protein SEA_RENNA12_67 [Arthrobacter phage Renna12]|nr:hypothetical protein SEA_RENNA12_67 [Arthrobacter phage Renna12]